MRLGIQQLGDSFGGGFHDSVQHVNHTLLGVVVGGYQTDAVGSVDATRGVVQVDPDLGLAVFRVQQLCGYKDQYGT